MNEVEVVNVPSRQINALFLPYQNRIEINSLLDAETYHYLLTHELKHAKIYAKHGFHTWRHLVLEVKDRWYMYSHPKLLAAIVDDGDRRGKWERLKDVPYMFLYNLVGAFTMLFIFATLFAVLKMKLEGAKKH